MADSDSKTTTSDKISNRPAKRARQTATGHQHDAVEALFAKPADFKSRELKKAKTSKDLPPPPEIVTNVQGSSAGAGSGEFHVYKAARRREYERLRLMEDEARQEEEDKQWADKVAEDKAKTDSKTEKARKRRNKKKENLKAAKMGVDASAPKAATDQPKTATMAVPPRLEERQQDGDGDGDSPMAGADTDEPEENGVIIHDDE